MNVYEFRSRCWPIRALTPDRTGSELPADYAPWDVQNDGAKLSTLDPKDVLHDILVRHGFFLTCGAAKAAKRENGLGAAAARIEQPPPLLETLSGCSYRR
jgi:hypothetical protein